MRARHRAALTPSESQEQVAVVQWFKQQFPRDVIVAIPNGSHLAGDSRRRAIKMHRMKKEGLLPGTADLFVAVARGGMHGAWWEMKSLDGRPTPEQLSFGIAMRMAGYEWACCYGAADAIERIRAYMAS